MDDQQTEPAETTPGPVETPPDGSESEVLQTTPDEEKPLPEDVVDGPGDRTSNLSPESGEGETYDGGEIPPAPAPGIDE